MASIWRRLILRPIANMFNGADAFLTKIRAPWLKKQILGNVTDKFAEMLLRGMDLFIFLTPDKDFRKNLKNFNGRYCFKGADKAENIRFSATFHNGDMQVHKEAINDWDVMVTFRNGKAFRDYIFSEKQDIFNSISENAVEVDGNLNYIFKFGFIAQHVAHKLGIA